MIPSSTALRYAFPSAIPAWLDALVAEAQRPGVTVDTPDEWATFGANLSIESRGLTRFEESLFYSTPQRIVQVWPHRFALRDADGKLPFGRLDALEYIKDPVKLANYIYSDANRSPSGALGNTLPGDGWTYRGRGPIQITGKNNYMKCSEAIGVDLIHRPELLLMPTHGVRSAFWFWSVNGLDKYDDDADIRAETRLITGGASGLAERQRLRDEMYRIFTKGA